MKFQEIFWWRPHYFPYKNLDFYDLIIKNEKSKIGKKNPFYTILFIFFTLIDELNVKSKDIDYFISIVKKDKNKKHYKYDNEFLKIKNFNNALLYIDSKPLLEFDSMLVDQIITIIKRVNKIVGDGIWNSKGFRSNHAKPSKEEGFFYSSPLNIRGELIFLVRNTVNLIKLDADCAENIVKAYSYFFTNFLKIHPFINGNGRTVRISSYYLFKKFISIPIIFSSNRQVYLKCLSESHVNNNKEAFTALLLESLHHSYQLYDYYS
jgi:hypothetical protein